MSFDHGSNCIATRKAPNGKLRVFVRLEEKFVYRNARGEQFVDIDLTRGDIIALQGQMERLDMGKMG